MANKHNLFDDIKRQVNKNHLLILDDVRDYLGLMPYVISPAHQVVAFGDGVSRGTKYTIDKAEEKNVITQVFNVVN